MLNSTSDSLFNCCDDALVADVCRCFPRITSVVLYNCRDAAPLDVLCGASWAPCLRSLDMSATRARSFQSVALMTQLAVLRLGGSHLEDDALACLVPLAASLRTLEIGHNDISDGGAAYIAQLSRLSTLLAQMTRIEDQGLQLLCARLRQLRKLSVAGTLVGCEGLRYVLLLECLVWLDVSQTRVGDGGLRHIVGARMLEHLDVTRTRATAAGVAALRQMWPECCVLHSCG